MDGLPHTPHLDRTLWIEGAPLKAWPAGVQDLSLQIRRVLNLFCDSKKKTPETPKTPSEALQWVWKKRLREKNKKSVLRKWRKEIKKDFPASFWMVARNVLSILMTHLVFSAVYNIGVFSSLSFFNNWRPYFFPWCWDKELKAERERKQEHEKMAERRESETMRERERESGGER